MHAWTCRRLSGLGGGLWCARHGSHPNVERCCGAHLSLCANVYAGKVAVKKEDLQKYHGKDTWFQLQPVSADSEVQVSTTRITLFFKTQHPVLSFFILFCRVYCHKRLIIYSHFTFIYFKPIKQTFYLNLTSLFVNAEIFSFFLKQYSWKQKFDCFHKVTHRNDSLVRGLVTKCTFN